MLQAASVNMKTHLSLRQHRRPQQVSPLIIPTALQAPEPAAPGVDVSPIAGFVGLVQERGWLQFRESYLQWGMGRQQTDTRYFFRQYVP